MWLGGETFSYLDIVYGRAAHIYGIQSRHDKKNVVMCKTRKDFNAWGNQGNFKKNRNGNGNFQGKNGQGYNNKGQSERVYHCKNCSKSHLGRDCMGDLVTCIYCRKKGHKEYECLTKQKKEKNGNRSGNQVKSGFNQSRKSRF